MGKEKSSQTWPVNFMAALAGYSCVRTEGQLQGVEAGVTAMKVSYDCLLQSSILNSSADRQGLKV